MNKLFAAVTATLVALTLTACGDSYAAAYEELGEVEGVDKKLFKTIAESSCKIYAAQPPEFYRDNDLPTADEVMASAVAEGRGLELADARYVVRMAGINVCPEDALPHLFEDGQEALDDPVWREENLR